MASPFHARNLLVHNQRHLLLKDERDGRKRPIADRSEAATGCYRAMMADSAR